jgi:hypothetical protein
MNDTAAQLLNATDGGGEAAATACPTLQYPATLFLTPATSWLSPSTYTAASDQAHVVLGVLLLVMVGSWAAYVLDACSVRRAALCSGACQTSMGVYLFTWLAILMRADDPPALWRYVLSDLLQLQHLAIAALLCAGGVVELLQSGEWLLPMSSSKLLVALPHATTLRLSTTEGSGGGDRDSAMVFTRASLCEARLMARKGNMWHQLWCACLMLVGLVFMLHPQHSYSASTRHVVLGASLALGSPWLTRAKGVAWSGRK